MSQPSTSESDTLKSLEGLTFSVEPPPAQASLSDEALPSNPSAPLRTPPNAKTSTVPTPSDPRVASNTNTRIPSPGKAKQAGQEIWNEKEDYEQLRETRSKNASDTEFDEKHHADDQHGEESKAEIASIMEQFKGETNPDITSPTREHPIFQYPPRMSSLEHLGQQSAQSTDGVGETVSSPTMSIQDGDRASISYAGSIRSQPPPEPDPEPSLPFDFHRFLEQLRHRTADPVARFLRSFLQEFGKKQWQVNEQVKIINDFLTFITNRMAQCEVWRNVSEAEFDNAKEGMEKLVMNRLYTQTFSPEIPPGEPSPVKGRRKGMSTPLGTGRRGQHQEDVEKDEVLAQKIRIYGWIREEHLDIKPFNDKGRRFLQLAQQELVKIKSYRAPRDKVICVLNCCKVIFGFLRNAESDQSADAFIPLLIYTVLKAKPDHIFSNIQYIIRFRNADKLGGEAGYYMSSLSGAVQFIENLDRTNLTVSDVEFDKNVEAAVSEIAARNERDEKRQRQQELLQVPQQGTSSRNPTPTVIALERAIAGRSEAPRSSSTEGDRASTRLNASDEQSGDEKAAVSGLLRTIQRPLSTIGRIFSEESAATPAAGVTVERPPLTPQPSTLPRRSTSSPAANNDLAPGAFAAEQRSRLAAEDAAAMQASAETAEAHRIMQAEHRTVVETLAGMFPDLDKEIIDDVVRMKEGRIGQAVDACLALSR